MNWGTAEFQSLFLEPSRNGVYKPKEFHGSGAKIINMGELFAYDRVGGQPMARLNMTDHELLKSGVQSGDLLFGRRSLVEEGAGRCAIAHGIAEPTTFESSIIRVRLNPELADPSFYFYYFRSPLVWCLKSNHQIMVLAARATDAKMVSALLCHTNGLGSSL